MYVPSQKGEILHFQLSDLSAIMTDGVSYIHTYTYYIYIYTNTHTYAFTKTYIHYMFKLNNNIHLLKFLDFGNVLSCI